MSLAQQLRRRLAAFIAADTAASEQPRRGRLLLETLERRQMMAGDVDLFATDVTTQTDSSSNEVAAQGEADPQGEPGLNLVELAQWLKDSGFEMYGAYWCPACTQQKQLFEDGGDDLPFTEVTLPNADRSQDPQFASLNITQYPTWILPNNERLVGVQSIETLIAASNFTNSTDERPTFEPIGSQTVAIGSPLHVPVDGYDAEGGPLTVTVSVENPSLLEATVLTGNRSLRLDMNGYEDMVFELFEQRAPEATGRVIDLAESGFYDGIIFHRVVDDFVIQGGDPTGTGTGGSTLGDFDDDFHPDLQHNRTGVLSFAKSSDDTNDSQFFVTEVATRFLDFNHSVFGQLVEGESAREAISENHVGANDKPTNTVSINNATIFNDTENSVVMLKALGGTGTTNVTFTITDEDGNSFSEVVSVTVTEDVDSQGFAINSQPYLQPVTNPGTITGSTTTIQLDSVDVEGDAVSYFASSSSSNVTVNANASTGEVLVTAADGFSGTATINVGVRAASGAGSNSDNQRLVLTFDQDGVTAPTGIDLDASSDTGSSSTDNITREGAMTFNITGVTSGATVEIIDVENNNTVLGVGVATGTSISITTNNLAASGQRTYVLAARQTVNGETSSASPTISVTYDTTAPTFNVNTVSKVANVSTLYSPDLISSEEGSGLSYGLTNSPTGASITASTGVISWTPTESQLGDNNFTVTLTDAAGNVRTETFTVEVFGEPLAGVQLIATDLNGNAIDSIDVGDEFLLSMYGVDRRSRANRSGVYATFADILFDGSLVRAVPGTQIDYESPFNTLQKGTLSSGLFDEIGAVSGQTSPSNLETSLIATVRMEALAAGSVNFVSEPADDANSEVLLFFNNEQVPAEAVDYGSVSLAIGQSFTAVADSFSVEENSGVTVLDVLANDTVVSGGGSLTVVSVTQPADDNGSVNLSGGEVQFTPRTNFVGTVEFTYRVSDSGGVQEDVPVTVTVTDVNDPPVGVDDTYVIDAGTSNNSLTVLDNDQGDTGETLTVTGLTTPTAGGTVAIASDGQSINYTPAAGFTGIETFNYTLSDGTSTDTVSVSITVQSPDDPPTAVNDAFPATGDAAIVEDSGQASYDVTANDTTDADNQSFTIESIGTPSDGGSVSISSDGNSLLYQPAANFNGTETVTYTIRDTGGGFATATATFTVTAVNDPPPIEASGFTVLRGAGQSTVLSISDLPANVDSGETLTFTNLSTTTAGGTVSLSSDNTSILYTPPSSTFSGEDTFTFEVTDGNGDTSGPETMTITVAAYQTRNFTVQYNSSAFNALNRNFAAFTLQGTNILGEDVMLPLNDSSVQVNGDSLEIPDLLPGSYTLNIPAIPFLHNGGQAQQISLESAVDDGDATLEVNLGRVRAKYLSVADWFGSAPRRAVLAAVEQGSNAIYALPSSSTSDDLSDIEVELDADGNAITVRAQQSDDSGTVTPVSGTANLSDFTAVQSRGREGDMFLVLVNLDDTGIGFSATTQTASAQANTAAAGESVSVNDVFVPGVNPNAVASGEDTELGLDSEFPSEVSPAGESLSESSVDQAMASVLPEIQLISTPGDEVAAEEEDGLQTFSSSVDQVLTTRSDS